MSGVGGRRALGCCRACAVVKTTTTLVVSGRSCGGDVGLGPECLSAYLQTADQETVGQYSSAVTWLTVSRLRPISCRVRPRAEYCQAANRRLRRLKPGDKSLEEKFALNVDYLPMVIGRPRARHTVTSILWSPACLTACCLAARRPAASHRILTRAAVTASFSVEVFARRMTQDSAAVAWGEKFRERRCRWPAEALKSQ